MWHKLWHKKHPKPKTKKHIYPTTAPATAPTTAPTIAPRKKKAFLSRDELKAAVDEYCEEPNGWVSNSKYSDYG